MRNLLFVLAVAIAVGTWFGWESYQYVRGLGVGDTGDAAWQGVTLGFMAFALIGIVLMALVRLFSRYVFISYARADAAYAREVRRRLRRGGVKVWMDVKLRLGDEFPAVLERKIDGCAGFVLIMSPASEASEWVEREARRAEAGGKPILPILLAGSPPDWIASKYHYFEASDTRRFWKNFSTAVTRHTG